MLPSAGSGRPACETVAPGHDQLILMTINTERLLLMTGHAIIRVAFCQNSMIVPEIQRMRQAVEIVAFVTGGAVIILMTV